MTATMKVLGQSYPAAATGTTLYTVPAGTSATISTIAVCNQTSGGLTFNLAVIPSGGALSNSSYIAYGTSVAANTTAFITIGVTLAAGDSIYVYNSSVGISYSAFGAQLT